MEVVVRVESAALGRLADAVGGRAVREAQRIGPPDADGRQTLRVMVDWPDEAPGRFVAAAPDVEVIEPARLRDEIIAAATAAIGAYSRP
jgi:hypothetical protein